MVTIAIMGIAFVAILSGVAIAITASDSHRQEATAEGDHPQLRRADQRSQGHAVRGVRVGRRLPEPEWFRPARRLVRRRHLGDLPPAGRPAPRLRWWCASLGAEQLTLQVVSPARPRRGDGDAHHGEAGTMNAPRDATGARRRGLHAPRAHHRHRDPRDHHCAALVGGHHRPAGRGQGRPEVQRLTGLADLGRLLRQRRLQREHHHEGWGGCGGPGTPIVSFAWTSATDPDSADVDASPTSTVTYTYDPSSPSNRLLRQSCGAGGAGQSVARDLARRNPAGHVLLVESRWFADRERDAVTRPLAGSSSR